MSRLQPTPSTPILSRNRFKSCHIVVPDLPKPVAAIQVENEFFSYFRLYPTTEAARKSVAKLMARGDRVMLTEVRKGLILWVFESEATLPRSSTAQPNKP